MICLERCHKEQKWQNQKEIIIYQHTQCYHDYKTVFYAKHELRKFRDFHGKIPLKL